ncbi:TrkH family potassium uptake protein [Puniceibacterium sp. IMCC21224]|uniref:TrkH family potassium uptake protein n=1 Tax=Puniceibacterium sp. IMCC21224 TaxID=1618204 RepID=UPI00064D8275|nr:potassium transporter TrkG [Puniceibacterium sp. IMCC21224]KMK66964.1 Trk-type K+ transport system, membrane component [Puniceibacterium sp. IMCC21224]
MRRLFALPFLLLLAILAFASMIVPAVFALMIEEHHDSRSFFYAGVVGLVLCTMIAIAQATRQHNQSAMRQLLGLLAAFVVLPAILAVPFHEAVRNTTFLNAYFEMVSSLTTTGATLFDAARLSPPEHLWRAQVGWMGGLLMWVSAAAILAPLTLGGFEVTAMGEPGQSPPLGSARLDMSNPARRLERTFGALFPIYTGLTVALWIMLVMAGDLPLVALIHAMSAMATSGISPVGGIAGAQSGLAGEMILFCFLFFALSRLTFSRDTSSARQSRLRNDPEFRMGLILIVLVPALLFMRHWLASFEVGEEENLIAALHALWGAVFTTLSFLTTTGFVSADWISAQGWSGLSTPGLIFMGLALIGGGVATTAGGVKLLRVFVLYLNARREIEKLTHPSSIGRSGPMGRRMRREGAFIAWVFFMIFALTLAAVTLALTALGVDFESALILTIATLSNTGPLVLIAGEVPIDLVILSAEAKSLLCLAMILGRLEMLALIVILTPDIWRE